MTPCHYTPLVPPRILLPFGTPLLWFPSCTPYLCRWQGGQNCYAYWCWGVPVCRPAQGDIRRLSSLLMLSFGCKIVKSPQLWVHARALTIFTSFSFMLAFLKAYSPCDKNSSCASLTNVSEVPWVPHCQFHFDQAVKLVRISNCKDISFSPPPNPIPIGWSLIGSGGGWRSSWCGEGCDHSEDGSSSIVGGEVERQWETLVIMTFIS